MIIRPFAVEEWMNAWETEARFNIAETCVDSLSADELFALTGTDRNSFLNAFCSRRMTYGDIEGNPRLKAGICSLYDTVRPEDVVTTHGAAGANHHVFYSLISPGDHVISVMPTYQQLYSIPESYGAEVSILHLLPENRYLPDLKELRKLVRPGTKMICINNPNNPTGAMMEENLLKEIADIARRADAYVLCDEVYRGLTREEANTPSIADLYEKGIAVGSMSKVFSLAGLRLGWIACRDREVTRSLLSHRDYNLISCGLFDEALAAVALEHQDAVLGRSRRIVRENLAILDAWVQNEPMVHYIQPQAGTTALVCYDSDMDSRTFCRELLKETGTLLTPGECFEESGCFRVGYACDQETLRSGLKAVSCFMHGR